MHRKLPNRWLSFCFRGSYRGRKGGCFVLIFGGEYMVKSNGEDRDVAGMTVTEYLASTDYNPKRVAVERNGEIVFKAQYDETTLEDGDTVEVVSFVGGG